ncbi:Shikimate dehydrogenase [Slackia heliotrinireducens]|uniref:Shikimate dehydrogenase (NADP(+)) n=1 Tax=Slackia heliotrinireducens (strain ATCC 29202 / DSM 20476 / NCTC 11029 / RHS 1) TaxID=471855 RepID=C7N3X4_SLAHD|nr:shikimate dehydrogenase [Slackia heliotrinireducens]ACV21715.1 shikimate 5-dehydrogenase [Slackia heliotrinireducens DSM 20476]VEG99355.1 Shikimate dehydrogenase [Slackia heliotrinireducens]
MGEPQRITGHTHLITLLGSPVAHSSSPVTHNLSFEKLGIDTVYLCLEIGADEVGEVVNGLKRTVGWDGSNVTMPCKNAVIPFLDELDPAAELMDAVNVIKNDNGKLKGYNTDGAGFVWGMRQKGVDPADKTVTLIGPGGAGSAVAVQLALDGAKKLNVVGRQGKTFERARDLVPRIVEKTGCDAQLFDIADQDNLRKLIAESDVLVNASNVGMGAGSTESLVPVDYLRPELVVCDTVYFPRETQLILDAKALGCVTVPGLGMMIGQAAEGERIWYDAEMPVDFIVEQLFSE